MFTEGFSEEVTCKMNPDYQMILHNKDGGERESHIEGKAYKQDGKLEGVIMLQGFSKSVKEECQEMQTSWPRADYGDLCRPGLDFGPHPKGNRKILLSFIPEVGMIRDFFTKISCCMENGSSGDKINDKGDD